MLMSLHFGRHFWLDDDNELMSCPTFVDGNPDLFNEDYVSEWTDLEGVDLSKLLYIHKSLLLEAVSLAKICDAGRYGPEAGNAAETLQTKVGELLKKIDKEIV